MKRSNYVKALIGCNSYWIMQSFKNPNKFMTKSDLILHAVAYRRMTGINLYSLKGV
jgi:hypothetical protein